MCKRPCRECPYTKNAIPGYFGGHNPTEYRDAINMDTIVACHTKSQYDGLGLAIKVVPCVGHIVSQIASCKSPRPGSIELTELHQQIRESDNFEHLKQNALSIFTFDAHHNGEHAT